VSILLRLRGLFLGLLLVVSLLELCGPKLQMVSAPSEMASLIFEPPYIEVFTNDSFSINVVVFGVVNLAGFNLTIAYDYFHLGVLGVEVPAPFKCVYQNVAPYVVEVYGVLSEGQPPQNGTVILATVSFRAQASGSISLFFRGDTVLMDSEGTPIPIYWPPPECTIIIHSRTIVVPDDYPTIQEAVNAAFPGDTIYVRAGIYQERVNVTKASLKIMGENWETVTVQGGFYINACSVSLTNFRIVESGDFSCAVHICCYNVTVQHNIIEYSPLGVFVNSTDCKVLHNLIRYCYSGIRVNESHNTISHNNITQCAEGIEAIRGNYITIHANSVMDCSYFGIGIGFGYGFVVSGNVISNCGRSDPDLGSAIVLLFTNARVTENLIQDNLRGLYIFEYRGEVLGNGFINNSLQVDIRGPCLVMWDGGYPKGGNYWSDYNGSDFYWGVYQNMIGSDGIGDVPYTIDQDNVDRYPLMKSPDQCIHDMAIVSATINVTVAAAGDIVRIEVLIKNAGDKVEGTTLQIYANDILLATRDIILPINETELFAYEWQINVPKGNYTIWAWLSIVEGETNTGNNIQVAGTITVTKWHNIAVSVVMPKAQYCWGETAKMGIIIDNQGDYPETVNLCILKPRSWLVDYVHTEIPPGISSRTYGGLGWGNAILSFNITINNLCTIPRNAGLVLLITPKDPPVGDPIVTIDPNTGGLCISAPVYKTIQLNPCSQTLVEVEYPPLKTFSVWLYLIPADNISMTSPISVSIYATYCYFGGFQATYGPSNIGQRFVLLENGSVAAANFEWTPDGYLPFSGYAGYEVYCSPVDGEFVTHDNEAWGIFYVVEPPQLLISNVTITDQNGNPKSNFGRGEVVQFDISITNLGSSEVESFLTAVMVLDPSGTPQFICYALDGIGAGGTRRSVFGFRIPSECPAGTYTARVMIFTGWPSEGGIGLDVQTITFNVS